MARAQRHIAGTAGVERFPATGWTWPALTGLRGVAALGVFAVHAYQLAGQPGTLPAPVGWLFAMGGTGVDVFFVLSAFLLSLPWLRAARENLPPPSLHRYALRRIARVLPAYEMQLLLLLLADMAGIGGSLAWRDATIGEVVAHLLLWINAWPLVPARLPPWWTLPVELGFYLLLPWLVTLLAPGRRRWLVVLAAVSLGWRWLLTQAGLPRIEEVMWVDALPGRLHQFLVGMLAAEFWVRNRQRIGPWSERLAWAAAAVFVALPALGFVAGDRAYVGGVSADPLLQAWHLFSALVVGALLVALACRPRIFSTVLSAAPLRAVGELSYSFYLWHYPVLVLMRAAPGSGSGPADFVGFVVPGLIASIAVATASWWLVERPAQAWSVRARLRA